MPTKDESTLETTLLDGRRVTLSLRPTGAAWASDGVTALRHVRPTHSGRGDEPPALPVRPDLPLHISLLGVAIL